MKTLKLFAVLVICCQLNTFAQDDVPAAAIQILDEPKAVDPATLVPQQLAAKATFRFSDMALVDVAKWVQQKSGMNVVLDRQSLTSARILPSEPVNDELNDAPIYLLLDRLKSVGVAWNLSGTTILLLSNEDSQNQLSTVQYNVGDLFDKEYLADNLRNTIVYAVEPESWDENGGKGGIVVLGDVLFVRQSNRNHRRVSGLLTALRNHGRRTLIEDTPIHTGLRQSLDKTLSVQFQEKPLLAVLDELNRLTGVDLRLDIPALRLNQVPDRLPITFEAVDQKLRDALNLMLPSYGLAWQVNDGAVWVTTLQNVEQHATTAVFDVRDLSRDTNEANALQEAIQGQAAPDTWQEGIGAIEFPVAGTLVVRQTEKRLDEVLQLLENYRAALRVSKRRVRPESDPKAFITQFYRMPTTVANDLETMLPQLIHADTWKVKKPDAKGTIQKIQSWSETTGLQSKAGIEGQPVPYSVLVIYQTREIHDQLPELFRRIQHGDGARGGMGGMGGGGFGGGFFAVPDLRP